MREEEREADDDKKIYLSKNDPPLLTLKIAHPYA